jgi:hypothetical protein
MQMRKMQQGTIVPVLDGAHAGMRSKADAVLAATETAGAPEKRERAQKIGGAEGGSAEATQGRFYPFWHYALGYKEKWFESEEKARKWAVSYGYKPDF